MIFDLDGTLVDSLDDIAGALGAAMNEHGLVTPARDDVRRWVGDGARALVERAVARAHGVEVDRVFARFRDLYRATPVAHTRPYPGVPELVDALAARGRALAVLSNKPHDLTVTIVERFFADRFAVVAGERAGTPRKPHPAAALAIATALGTSPTDCALVGDSAVDVECARAAGMGAIAVTWGLRPRDELALARPDHLADNPSEVLAILADPGLTRS